MKAFPKYWIAFGFLVTSLTILGCDDGASTGGESMDALAAQIEQNKKAAADSQAAAEAQAAKQAAAAEAQAEAAKRAADEEAAKQAAAVADTRRGTTAGSITVGQGGGYYSAIAGAHHYMKHEIEDLAWIEAVKSYWAEQGHYPKSHEEFMQCLKKYDTELPALEQGQEYLYDPNEGQFGTLYVVEQQPATAAPLQ
jgi:hypothetical protein